LYLSRQDELAEYPLEKFQEGEGFMIADEMFICVWSDSIR